MVVRGEGVLFFFNGCGNGESRCNGRGKLLALRKASGDSAVLDGLVRGEVGEIFQCVGFNNNRFIDRVRPHL